MRKNMIIIGILVIGLFALTGCGTGNTTVGPIKTPFVGGVTALSMEFIEGAPPDVIFDNDQNQFSINLKLENKGEFDVTENEGFVEILGIDPKEFGHSGQADFKKNFPYDIRGVRRVQSTVISGEPIVLEINDLNYKPQIRGNRELRIRADLCYNYETEATTAICLKKDMLTNINTKEICEVSGNKVVYNSGAPIQVTKVTQNPLGSGKVSVQFEISHVGTPNDRFYRDGSDCDDRSTNMDKDKVYFEVIDDINGNKAECLGLQNNTNNGAAGYVTLYGGKPRTISCTFNLGNIESVYEKHITAKMRYRYSQFIEKAIVVEDVSQG